MKQMGSPADFSHIKRNSIKDRQNLVKVSDFCAVPAPESGFCEFLDSLPRISHRTNAADSLRLLVNRIVTARNTGKVVSWGLGPHVVKYGLSRLIIEMMECGYIQHILTNGAGAIHDAEIAMIGETSEEMGGHISRGDFGMAQETGQLINEAARRAWKECRGFGETLGDMINESKLPFRDYSILAQARLRAIPTTIHVALGTDIIHMHPDMDGSATGAATHTDFRIFVSTLREFVRGGVHLNIGSTVILPEIFVKAMTCANNLNQRPASDYTTVNIDHLSEYRPLMNVVQRGSMDGGEGYEIIGRLEILVPLLIRCLLAHFRHE